MARCSTLASTYVFSATSRACCLLIAGQVKMGRDHTIYATVPGFVRFYKEKHMLGERSFVGVVLERGDVLPRDESTRGRSRFCGLIDRNGVESTVESS